MNKINENSRQQLTKIGFSDREINIMELSPRMVRLINEYKGEFKIRDDGLSGAYYSKGEIPEDDKIAFSNEYRKISTIAHELGHATREYQHPAYPKDYDTAQAYSEAYMLEEGKAYYIECKVMLELRRAGVNLLDIDPSLKTKDGEQVVIDGGIWEDNEIYSSQLSSYSKQIGKTYSKEIEDIVNNNDEGKSAFEKISKINAIMIPSGQDIKKEGKNDNSWGSLVPTPDDPPQLTYDEKNKWNYLAENVYKKSNLGDLKEDYKNVMGKELKKNSFHVKSLMNKANNFYGENGNDWISKQIGITPLAEWSKQGDLLYGGKGDDIIIGNSGRDILIGGDDNDTLSGESGDDILGGNNGKDTLYGGIGDDAYVADYEDTIYDSDGVGKVFLDGDINSQQLFGGVRRNGQDFYDDGTHEYLWSGNGSDLIIRRKGEKGQNGLKIEKFENKQLGITLREEGELPPSEPPPTSQRPKDPLSLDLDRNGKIDTLPRSAGVHFDLDNSGFAEQTSWLAPGDGFLVLDRNNNGHIDGGAELFGSETTLNSGKVAENGFEALAE
ncbi:calcium-binding protein [Cardiobacterium sp. Marseille-Q4385]|uniref:calcium-binding protein n=1 Tax=Cardiobacterium sp. Marseille-Q4385 TaxID=2866573 RepID=UPI001CE4AB07|nr:calcium-binding protein [Cardiobacterium sp. Marseille-Q4385]